MAGIRDRRLFPVLFNRGQLITDVTLKRSAAYWKAAQQVNERVLLDLTGGRNHAYAGSNKVAFIGGRGAKGVSLQLPGTASNYASTPDHADLDVTGDIDIRVKCALDDWTVATMYNFVSKRAATADAYRFGVANGPLNVAVWVAGAAVAYNSTVSPTVADGEDLWSRFTRVASTGTVTFYTSSDGVTWTQLGATVAGTAGNIDSTTAPLNVGAAALASEFTAGRIYRAVIKNGIDGTTVFDADFTTQAEGTLSFVEATGKTVTVNQAAATTNDPKYLAYNATTKTKYAYLPGTSGNYLSTPDSAALSILGDLAIDVDVALDDWTPAAAANLAGNLTAGAGGSGYELFVESGGTLRLAINNGVSDLGFSSTVATGLADKARKWVRVSLDSNDGAAGADVRFYLSDDGVTWTQLGATVHSAATLTPANAAAAFAIGATPGGTTQLAAGKFYRVRVANSDARATTPGSWVFDANLNHASVVEPYASFTESSSNAATVTFNRSASGRKTTLVDRTMWLLGTDDYFAVADASNLDFALTDPATEAVAYRHAHQSGTTTETLLAKKVGNLAEAGYALYKSATANEVLGQIADGTVSAEGRVTKTGLDGRALVTAAVRSVASDNLTGYTDNTAGTAAADGTAATQANAEELRIGRLSGAGTTYGNFAFIGAGVWREALTATEVAALDTEFGTAA